MDAHKYHHNQSWEQFIMTHSFMLSFTVTDSHPVAWFTATTDLSTISIIMSLWECYIKRIIPFETGLYFSESLYISPIFQVSCLLEGDLHDHLEMVGKSGNSKGLKLEMSCVPVILSNELEK